MFADAGEVFQSVSSQHLGIVALEALSLAGVEDRLVGHIGLVGVDADMTGDMAGVGDERRSGTILVEIDAILTAHRNDRAGVEHVAIVQIDAVLHARDIKCSGVDDGRATCGVYRVVDRIDDAVVDHGHAIFIGVHAFLAGEDLAVVDDPGILAGLDSVIAGIDYAIGSVGHVAIGADADTV